MMILLADNEPHLTENRATTSTHVEGRGRRNEYVGYRPQDANIEVFVQ